MTEAGKGSQQRPRQISNEEYANRWDAIFARDITPHEALELMVRDAEALGLYDEFNLQKPEKPTTGVAE